MKITRKTFLKGLGTSLVWSAFGPGLAFSRPLDRVITRAIPNSGEQLPVVGLGTAYGFGASSSGSGFDQRKEVLRILIAEGGQVIDTSPSPSYGNAEDIIGRGLSELGERGKAFIATKISTFGKSSGVRQMENSFRLLKTNTIDLLQVHNLKDTVDHLRTIRAAQEEDRVRYVGVTHYLDGGISGLMNVLNSEKIDFIQCHYSALERAADRRLLDLAKDKGVAVIANRPFARGAVFRATRGKDIPAWATEELGVESWGQFFLKFTLSHPAVTVAIPGTDKPHHMLDNAGAAYGPLPDQAQRKKMIQFINNL